MQIMREMSDDRSDAPSFFSDAREAIKMMGVFLFSITDVICLGEYLSSWKHQEFQ
jgi:hypothetical protein